MPKPTPVRLSDPTEICVTATWDKVKGATSYIIRVKSVVDDAVPWDETAKHDFNADITSGEIDGLEPTNTYIFRLIAVTPEGDSEMSEEAMIDTLVAGCGGSGEKKKSGCCEVQ